MTEPTVSALTLRQEKRALVATAIISGMGFADMVAVNTALPVIQGELGLDATSALWIAEIYLLFVASLMMMGGALGDRFGRRRVLQFGVYAFAASSVFCAMSDTGATLIAARAVQGLAAAITMPTSLALLNACYPPERRGAAIGGWTAISSMMIPLGPLVGGAAVDLLSWQWIFLINLPLCAAALLILRGVPTPPYGSENNQRLDVAGIAAITGGLGALVFALLEGARNGFDAPLVIAALIAAAVLLPMTILIEAKSKAPMLPLWMFRRRTFTLANGQTFLFFAGFQGALFLLPFFHIQVYGFTAFQAGAAGLPISVAMIVLSKPVGRLMDRIGAGPLLAVAPFAAAGGLALLTQAPAEGTYLVHILPGVCLIGLGLALFIAPVTTVALSAAGEDKTGLASAVNNTVARVAGLVSVALMGVLLSAGFAGGLVAELSSLDLSEAQVAHVAAQVHHLGVLAPPQGLTTVQTEAFQGLVRESFTVGFSSAVTIAGLFMVMAGVTGAWGLRTLKK